MQCILGRLAQELVPFFFELVHKTHVPGLHDPPALHDVHVVGLNVVQQPLQ